MSKYQNKVNRNASPISGRKFTGQSLSEVETTIKNNDKFCKKTKSHNIVAKSKKRKGKGTTMVKLTDGSIIETKVLRRGRGSEIRAKIAQHKQETLVQVMHSKAGRMYARK